ncbi:amino acid adenylation domain-containing protein [Streptomyces sp. NPDC050287]|uniref:amino acid adenylation domain-containing protein n=1 Tax=Streptomyces sp. NPDC050287 TaxID=3365608 RepID=UPI00378F1AA3
MDRVGRAVTDAFRAVLKIRDVDPGTRFADLGGTSLLAVRVLSRCWRDLGVELALDTLTPDTTPKAFADLVRLRLRDEGNPPVDALPVQPGRSGGSQQFTQGQKALYSLYALDPSRPTYNVPVLLTFRGTMDDERLRRALDLLVSRHEALRAVVETGPDGPLARIHHGDRTVLEQQDLTGVTDDGERAALAERLVERAAREPLDLAVSQLRARLITLSAEHHLLVLVTHHIVCDGWSLRILLRDLTHLYRDGEAARLPELPKYGFDAVSWERERLEASRREELRRWWQQELRDAPELIDLPHEGTAADTGEGTGSRLPFALSPEETDRVNRFASEHGTTVFAALAAALAILLRRYSGQRDVVLGFPAARRQHPDSHEVVGYLLNMIPLRLTPGDDLSAGELVRRAHRAVTAAYERADLPFDAITDAVAPVRSPGRHPLFQVALVLMTEPYDLAEIPGLRIERRDLDTGTSKFDMSLYLEDEDGGLTGYAEFSANMFSVPVIARMLRHFRALLLALADRASTGVGALPMLEPAERAELATALAVSAPGEDWHPVHVMFERQADQQPERCAVWFQGEEIGYRDLNARAGRLAHQLRERGIRSETVVGIHVGRSPAQLVAVLAVLKAGAAYLALDPADPAALLSSMVEDAGIGHVISTVADRGALASLPDRVQVIDVGETSEAPGSADNLGLKVEPGQLACVSYIRGSSGPARGVELTHRSVSNLIRRSQDEFRISDSTRVLQFASFSSNASVWEIFMALCTGATLCLGPADPARVGTSVQETIRTSRATLVHLPPDLLSIDPESVPSVKILITRGERIPVELRDRWVPRCRFFVAHEPTEGTIVQTWTECRTTLPSVLPIGRPLADASFYVLDSALEPVPLGAVGEVHVGGLAVARGYRNRPALTAERFLPDPYSPVPGSRMYRTGDLVRRMPGGGLKPVLRAGQQVSIRGYRVDMDEIEAAIRDQPEMEDAGVLAESGPNGRPQLVAYVVPAEPAQSSDLHRRVRDALRGRLPEHMIPSVVHSVPVLPLTVDGRIDRGGLSALVSPGRPALEDLLSKVEHLSESAAEALLTRLREADGTS